MSTKSCPNCNGPTTELIKIEAGMRLGLKEAGKLDGLPESVCPKCYADLGRHVSQGARLRAERKAKEANRLNLWRGRVKLVKQGRQLMTQRAFAEAAIAYEKYLRVLEIVYERDAGTLSPDLFTNTPRSKELTIITSVLWDLLRIYDTHVRYSERQSKVAVQLAGFAKTTPIFRDIVRKAVNFSQRAKNKKNFDLFLRNVDAPRARCFIATAAFDSSQAPTVRELCLFRDQVLRHSPGGRQLIATYYRHSPRIARTLDRYPIFKHPLRPALRAVAFSLSFLFQRNFRLKESGDQ